VESEKDLSMGAAAFKIAQLAKKKIPDNPALIYEMLHSSKSMKDPIEPLVKKLVVLLMEFETGLFLFFAKFESEKIISVKKRKVAFFLHDFNSLEMK
jgi:hypothetical protein